VSSCMHPLANTNRLERCTHLASRPSCADWDKVLPHLDYALFCIKSPIPGACAAGQRQSEGIAGLQPTEAMCWIVLNLLYALPAAVPLQRSTSGSPSARSGPPWALWMSWSSARSLTG